MAGRRSGLDAVEPAARTELHGSLEEPEPECRRARTVVTRGSDVDERIGSRWVHVLRCKDIDQIQFVAGFLLGPPPFGYVAGVLGRERTTAG